MDREMSDKAKNKQVANCSAGGTRSSLNHQAQPFLYNLILFPCDQSLHFKPLELRHAWAEEAPKNACGSSHLVTDLYTSYTLAVSLTGV